VQIHVEPRLLERLPADAARAFEHVWAPVDLLLPLLGRLPLGILRLWRESGRGHLVLSPQAGSYLPGRQAWRPQAGREYPFEGLCLISVVDLLQDERRAIEPMLRFVDHLLGSGAVEDGGDFSAGCGMNEALRRAAARFAALEALGYGHDALAVETPQAYFAETLWLHTTDRLRLSALDPLLAKLYDSTLFAERFWEASAPRPD
jgi:hypothetical protein